MKQNDNFHQDVLNTSSEINDHALENVAGGKTLSIPEHTWEVCPTCSNKSLLHFSCGGLSGKKLCTKCGYRSEE